MSKVTKKGSGIDFDSVDDEETAKPKADDRPRTAIGAISVSLAMGRGVEEENRALKDKVAVLEKREFVELLDPTRIRASKYANRHPSSFSDPAFESLREEIAQAGRNVQPIKVRPVTGDPAHDYEIVFGHRRHRACLELKTDVVATVAELDDQELFSEMDRENRDRESLSPWEQGRMYQRALELGLYPSVRKMAQEIGANTSMVAVAVQLAALPEEVVAAFPRPHSLQYRWAPELTNALEKDREVVLARAKEIIALGDASRTPKAVLSQLLAGPNAAADSEVVRFKTRGKVAGSFSRDGKGGLTLKVKAGALSGDAEEELLKFVQGLFKE
ncbi:ParB/RepB/Spo0J family partition protein [Variovorax saccharolyticus]|uniref:ParB/RepB/Spo0J family partition protein n=1 Tax=Variovorax saccharolyticus TaxID=3053516 RepID=UPI002575447F|nr:ParB/RepB/Spo0J family partition protein [Variovorax sp. J31P216]MDM0028824.1 ParB/RepB/Spo0J family partition protein [Variovorax sp. J31P216]